MATPIFPWIGGKRRLAKKLIPLFPEHQCYVEPFCGAAALFFMKQPSKVEVINDINGEVINLYRVAQHHLSEFVQQFKWALVSRKMFEWLNMTALEPLTDIQRAARFYYLQRMAFGGKVTGQTFGISPSSPPRLNLLRLEEDLSQAHLRLSRTTIENLSWSECVSKYDRDATLFYFDPPYWGTEGYGVDFPFDQYEEIARRMRQMKGKAILSVNDIPEMREVFAGFSLETTAISYTCGSGQAPRQELIIKNFDMPEP